MSEHNHAPFVSDIYVLDDEAQTTPYVSGNKKLKAFCFDTVTIICPTPVLTDGLLGDLLVIFLSGR
jgi:hypothetical protein